MTSIDDRSEILASFEEVALPHMKDLVRTAASMLGNGTEAEDAVQETYLEAWKSFHRFTPGTNCRAWLFKILFHVVSHRRRKWFSKLVFWEPEAFEHAAAAPEPVAGDVTDEEVLSAFRKIPQQFAEVVMLADVQEFSYKEIQETLNIPIGTVMSRLSRGRELLRSLLSGCAAQAGLKNARPAARATF